MHQQQFFREPHGPAGFVEIVKEEVRSRIDSGSGWSVDGHGSGMVEVLSPVIPSGELT